MARLTSETVSPSCRLRIVRSHARRNHAQPQRLLRLHAGTSGRAATKNLVPLAAQPEVAAAASPDRRELIIFLGQRGGPGGSVPRKMVSSLTDHQRKQHEHTHGDRRGGARLVI